MVSPYDEPLYENMTALNTRISALGARTVVSGLGGDEIVAVGSAESAQAALDKAENFDLPWRDPPTFAATPLPAIGLAKSRDTRAVLSEPFTVSRLAERSLGLADEMISNQHKLRFTERALPPSADDDVAAHFSRRVAQPL